jgi:hypothetical protein
MPKILLTILLIVSSVGFVGAQEATGSAAEEVKKEIIKLEQDKIRAFVSTTTSSRPSAVDWLDRVDAEDIAYTGADGSTRTKAEVIALFRSGDLKVYSIKQHDVHVRVYGDGKNGTTAVVTYINEADNENRGHRATHKIAATDVFVKADGQWRWVVHHHAPNLE